MFGKFVVNSGRSNDKKKAVKDSKESLDAGDFEEKSCFVFKRTFFVRKWFIHLVHWPWFERLSMLVILVNCVCLALADPLDHDCMKRECQSLTKINSFVLYFFVAEMVIKMIAMGVIGKKSYFSEGWNRLDFLIVAAGIVDEFSGLDGAFLVMMRLVRVLRPLRAINRVPSIRILVTLLLEALPLLGNVFALAFLVLFIFSIIGVQLWQGVLRNRCFLNSTLLMESVNPMNGTAQASCFYQLSFEEPDFLCSLPSDSGTKHCSAITPTNATCVQSGHANNGNYCEYNRFGPFSNKHYECVQDGPNPFYTTVSFDNIGSAWIVIFQIITLEGWSDIMYLIQEAHDYWGWIYFVILILLGPFFLVNLCLVVLAMQFQETKSRELQLLEEDRQRKLQAENVFKQTKWGKVLTVVKSNLSESLHKRSDQHIHHHHHFHHYYHHEHVVQSPRPEAGMDTSVNPTVVVSHHSSVCHTQPVIQDESGTNLSRKPTVLISHQSSVTQSPPLTCAQSQEPNDSIISLEMTSNCKISQNFLSPTSPYSGRLSPTWSVESVSSEQVCLSPDTVSLSSNEDLGRVSAFSSEASAKASATVQVNMTTCQVHEEPKHLKQITKTEVNALANASVKTQNAQKPQKASVPQEKTGEDASMSRKASPKFSKNNTSTSKALEVFKPLNKSPSKEAAKNINNPKPESLKVANLERKICREETTKNTPPILKSLEVFSSPNISSSKRNSLHTLDASNLRQSQSKYSEFPVLGATYRKRSESVEEQNKDSSLQVPSKRRGTEGSLEDRFGSMFDIQRHGLYYVSEERTSWQRFREICARLANNATFINFIMVVILVNTVTMATEHYQQPPTLAEFLEISNLIFITIFALEMIIKIIGEGIRAYMNQWFNIFDGFIVIISIIEVIILQENVGVSVLRSIRLLRIFRLIRPIRHQLIVMVHTMTSVVTFTALLFLFMFTFAVLGMNLFGGKLFLPSSNCTMETVRSNFDTFPAAMITIFQVLTLEDWNLVMQSAMRSTNHWASIYFIILVIIGYYVLFNLLVAILVEGFTNPLLFERGQAETQDGTEKEQHVEPKPTTDWLTLIKQAKEQPKTSKPSPDKDEFDDLSDVESEAPHTRDRFEANVSRTPSGYCGPAVRRVMAKPCKMDLQISESNETRNSKNKVFSIMSKNRTAKQSVLKSPRRPYDFYNRAFCLTPKDELQIDSKLNLSTNSKTTFPFLRRAKRDHSSSQNNRGFTGESNQSPVRSPPQIVVTSEDGHERKIDEKSSNGSLKMEKSLMQPSSKSLYIFSQENRFRRLMIKITSSRLFDNFVLFLIVLSCGFMVFDHPSNIKQNTDVIYTANLVFTVLFTIEVIIKVIAQGLVIGKGTYLRLGWNVLDFIIVLVSWLHVIISSFHSTSPGVLGSVKVLRALRTLRPLRMIRRAPGLKLVVGALLRSLKPIGNTVLIAGIFFVVFGILGVQLFKGMLYHCEDNPNVTNKTECDPHKWNNRPYNFDNLAQALVTLFVLATRDGWVTVMHYGVDAVGVDSQPKQNYNQWKVLYFMSFLMVVGFLVLNMVVGIVVSNYQLCQEKQENADRKLKAPKTRDTMKIVDKTRYDEFGGLEPSSFRGRCFRLCHNKYWDLAIALVICVNVILMSVEHYKMSRESEILLVVNNYVCTGIFIIEAFVKLTAVGWRCYFYDRWNILDFLVVLFSVAGIILDLVDNEIAVKPIVLRSIRVLRLIRVLKLFKVAKGVRSLLDTIIKSLPQVANLGIVLFLLFFIYSSLGIQLFGSIECSETNPCHGIDTHAHFRNFPTAMLTLFRVATGDNWNTIFMDTLRGGCDPSASCQKNCCFSKYMAPLYFTTFVLATHFVLLNVLVAVLMKDLKASREKLAEVLVHETLEKRVLKLTMSATKFVKEKARSRKSKAPEEVVDKHIELKRMRSISLEPD